MSRNVRPLHSMERVRNCRPIIHRNSRPDDMHLGKYNGLGGKMEPGEDIAACMRREILEEAGITCESMSLRGPRKIWWGNHTASR